MKTWNVYLQISAPAEFIFMREKVPVSEELYEQIQQAIQNNELLWSSDFSQELNNLAIQSAYASLDLCDGGKPERCNYDDEDSYRLAMNKYEALIDDLRSEFVIVRISFEDPGDLEYLKNVFVGYYYPNWKGVESETFYIRDEDRIACDIVTVYFDGNGTITDISEIVVEPLVEDIMRGDSFECYPDYDQIEYFLVMALETRECEDCEEYEDEDE